MSRKPNTYNALHWRRCRDCCAPVRRDVHHICLERGAFAARTVGALAALAFAVGAAIMAAEIFAR